MGRLRATVWLRDAEGRPAAFGPDDDVPDWAASQIGPHAWEPEPEPEPEREPEPEPEPPPRSGKGSGRDEWAAFAAGKVDVGDDMSRDDIIAALEAAGAVEAPAS